MIIERIWAMPSRWTFSIKPIRELLEQEVFGEIVDPFPGKSMIATIRNTDEQDALLWLQAVPTGIADTILYDPPYSMTQSKERYGKGFRGKAYWSKCKDEAARILKATGKAICFGWNSMGLGKNRGFKLDRVLLVAHGGNRNDTICTVETHNQEENQS